VKIKRYILIFLIFTVEIIFADSSSATVFMYHRFGESKYPSTSIRTEQFEAHLAYLEKNGYNVWSLSKIVNYLLEGRDIPEKTVALTIDDAYKSIYTDAFSRLKEKKFPFTIFVNTASIDSKSKSYMSWDEMREIKLFGAEFANHSLSHDYMLPKDNENKEQWQNRIRYEIETAQKRLHEELGADTNENPKIFSYPFGEYSEQTSDFIKNLGYIGVTQTSGSIDMQSDTKALPRFPMAEAFADIDSFVLKLKTLPLPISSVSPKEPLISSENPPVLTLELKNPIKNLQCYLSSGEPLSLEWISKTEVNIIAKNRLKRPRDKYTCTAKANGDRWYWYSHLWIVK